MPGSRSSPVGVSCPICHRGRMVWQAETVSLIPLHYLRCDYCGEVIKPG